MCVILNFSFILSLLFFLITFYFPLAAIIVGLHLRHFEGGCESRVNATRNWIEPMDWVNSISAYMPGNRPITPTDVCQMSDEYIEANLRRARIAFPHNKLRLLLTHDYQMRWRVRFLDISRLA